jgi:predicted transcriptional regulator
LGNYRGRLDIIAAVLNAVGDGAKKTQVMYKANLSYRLLTKYLGEVLKVGFIAFEVKKGRYVVTFKGRAFLERYKDYSRHSKRAEKHLEGVHDKRRVLEELSRGRFV